MSKVSRSVYQKLAEENKRLKADLKIIVMAEKPFSDEFKDTLTKYRKQFAKEDFFNTVLKKACEEYRRDNPHKFEFLNEGISKDATTGADGNSP